MAAAGLASAQAGTPRYSQLPIWDSPELRPEWQRPALPRKTKEPDDDDDWTRSGFSPATLKARINDRLCWLDANTLAGCMSALETLYVAHPTLSWVAVIDPVTQAPIDWSQRATSAPHALARLGDWWLLESSALGALRAAVADSHRTPPTHSDPSGVAPGVAAREVANARLWKNRVATRAAIRAGRRPGISRLVARSFEGQHRRISHAAAAGEAYNAFLERAIEPHANVMPTASNLAARSNGNNPSYVGAGLQLQLDAVARKILIREVFVGGPAEQAGVRAGEWLIGAGPEGTTLGASEPALSSVGRATDLLLGPNNTRVRVTLEGQSGTRRDVVITRGPIRQPEYLVQLNTLTLIPPTATSHTRPLTIRRGYLRLASFMLTGRPASGSDPGQASICAATAAALADFEAAGVKDLVLDLRGNPGGDLAQVHCIAGLFLGPSVPMLYLVPRSPMRLLASHPAQRVQSLLTPPDTHRTYTGSVAVLVDAESGSASEILAGILQIQYPYSLVIGQPTFGKGTFQRLVDLQPRTDSPSLQNQDRALTLARLPELAGLSLTVRETEGTYHFVNGASPQLVGVIPDLVIGSRD